MTFLPVVAREMSVAARRPSTYWGRAGAALAALVVSGWVLLLASPFVAATQLGRQLFVILSYTGFAFALFAGLFATADCISEEKREGTLGLLFLTDLRGYDVIFGKLSAGSVNAAFALCGLVPMIALGMLMGGVTLWDVGLMALALANALFLALGLGVFISTISTNERRAMFAGVVTLFVLTVGPFVIAFSMAGRTATELVIWLSPLYPVLAVHLKAWTPMGFTGASWQASLLLHHLLGWLFLVLSWAIVPLLINDLPALRFAGVRGAFDRLIYGSRTERKRHRARLLDRNAFLWLVSRERIKPRYAWVLVAFFAGLYGWVAWKTPNLLWDVAINASIVLIIHATLKVWLCSEVCSRLIQDRRSGALELLLTTPLGVKEIARGQSMALGRIFFWPVAFLAGAELFLAWRAWHDGFVDPPPRDRALAFVGAAGLLLLDAWALKWLGLWLSAWGKSIERVLLSTVARGLAVPTLVFASIYFGARMFSQMLGVEFSFRAMVLWWIGVNAAFALGFGWVSRWQFLRYFRHCAAARVDGKAPRAGEMIAETGRKHSPVAGWIPLWARAHPVAAAILVALAFAMAAGAGRRAYWHARVSAAAKKVRAEKLPVAPPELEGFVAKPAPGQDAGRILLEAGLPAESASTWTLWRDMLARNDTTVHYPGEQESFDETLAANGRQLKALWSITNCTGFAFPSAEHSMDLERFAALACIDYFAAVGSNDPARAVRDMHALIALARTLRATPYPHAQQVACDALRDAMFAWQRRLSVPPPELAKIALALETLEPNSVLKERLIVQRAFFLGYGTVGPIFAPGNHPQAHFAFRAVNAAYRAIGSDQKRLHGLLEDFQFALEQAAKPLPERLDALQAWRIPNFIPWNAPIRTTVDPLRSAIAQAFWLDAEFTARAAVLRTAVAFQRYYAKWGFLPEELSDLAPMYLREVPKDPFSGEPLRVKKGREWIIYSVGPNRADDGGAHQLFSESSDLIFRYSFARTR